MFLQLIFVACCLTYIWRKWRWRKSPPNLPSALPIIGHTNLIAIKDTCKFYTRLENLSEEITAVGGVATMRFGPWIIYMLTDPEDSMTVLNSCLDKDIIYDFWKPWLGQGLLTSDLETWKRHRKVIIPAFSQRLLDEYIGTLNAQARDLVKSLAGEVDKGLFDINPYLAYNNLNTILINFIGLSEENRETLETSMHQYLKAIKIMHQQTMARFVNVLGHSDYTYQWSTLYKEQKETLKDLRDMTSKILQMKLHNKGNNNNCEEDSGNLSDKNNSKMFLDLLIEQYKNGNFTEEEVENEIESIIFGGHDTSAATLMYIAIMIGSYPEVQNKIMAELQDVFINSNDDVEKHHLSKLIYLEAVIKESLRLYSFVPLVARKILKDIQLKKYTLYAGSRCAVITGGIHRSPIWGKDANEFRPERWLDPTTLPACPAAFAGFSWGKRGCPGKAYGMMSMKTSLVHLLRHYRISADYTKLVLRLHVVLKPNSGHHIAIQRRNLHHDGLFC